MLPEACSGLSTLREEGVLASLGGRMRNTIPHHEWGKARPEELLEKTGIRHFIYQRFHGSCSPDTKIQPGKWSGTDSWILNAGAQRRGDSIFVLLSRSFSSGLRAKERGTQRGWPVTQRELEGTAGPAGWPTHVHQEGICEKPKLSPHLKLPLTTTG